jgi:hypothetical protein
MNDFAFVRKNLFRKKLRACLMMVSILVAFLIFGVLASFYRAFTAGEERLPIGLWWSTRSTSLSLCPSPISTVFAASRGCGR